MKKIIIITIEIIFVILSTYSSYKIYIWYIENNKSENILEEISQDIKIDNDKNVLDIDLDSLKIKNKDTVGFLNVGETKISYPVVQTNNNEYYLNHSFDKTQNSAGWIFVDYKCKLDNTDKNIVIYGHNRKNGSMFGTLKNVLNEEWYNDENNKYITFIMGDRQQIYEVFSVYQIKNEEYYIKTDFNDEEFKDFIQTIKNRSINNFNTFVDSTDSILTLSTCANGGKYRIVLHSKKIQ